MRPIWTPWRMPYIMAIKSSKACVFCEEIFVEGLEPDLILHQGRHSFVVLNLYPYAVGHLMVVPYRHVASLHELTADELTEMTALLGRAERCIERALGVKRQVVGINVGRCAGAGVEGHLHIHLVPDGEGPAADVDILHPPGESLPEALPDTHGRLVKAWGGTTSRSHKSNS